LLSLFGEGDVAGGGGVCRCRLLGVVALLDSLLLAVADEPAKELRLVDADENVVDSTRRSTDR